MAGLKLIGMASFLREDNSQDSGIEFILFHVNHIRYLQKQRDTLF